MCTIRKDCEVYSFNIQSLATNWASSVDLGDVKKPTGCSFVRSLFERIENEKTPSLLPTTSAESAADGAIEKWNE